jgi:hypothetical protein
VHLAYPLPWWLAVILAAGVAAAAFVEYRRPLAALSTAQRVALVALRVVTLSLLLLFLFRPMVVLPPDSVRNAVVPIVVDVSRSMRIGDADGRSRLAYATALLKNDLLPSISARFATELYTVGDRLAHLAVTPSTKSARTRGRQTGNRACHDSRSLSRPACPGIVLLSDGGDTGGAGGGSAGAAGRPETGASDGPPVYAIGVGAPEGLHDRELLGLTAGDPRIDRASVDLRVSAVSYGFGRTPFTVRVLANGRLLEARRVTPTTDGSPIDETFTVSPDPISPTVYSAEIPVDSSEPVAENNTRSVLVSPAGRPRKILVIEGAPGFEHSFMTRAWAGDPGLEVDVVTRKGRNADNVDTFFVQAGSGRAAALTAGFPARRDQLFAYDAW